MGSFMHAIVTGGANGLGKAICDALHLQGVTYTVWDIINGVDVGDYASVTKAAAKLDVQLDMLINCAGINYIDWFEELEPQDFDRVMRVNAYGIFHCTRAVLSFLYGGGTVCNITSNASHMPMTASLAYNASKAAAAMITKQMAHELGPRYGITVFAISPNKLAGTNMSAYTAERVAQVRGWTKDQVQRRQDAALPAREETPIELLAEFAAFLLSKKERHKYLQGCTLDYGGP